MHANTRIGSALTLVALWAVTSTAPAATVDCSGSKRSKDKISSESVRPGDTPSHELKLAVRTHATSSRDADFNGSEQTVYAMEDAYGRAGTSVGYFLYTLTSGEKVWARFDSLYSVSPRPGDSWEVTYQGLFQFVRGTGKFAHIRGGGHYRGTITPSDGFVETFTCSAEY